MRIDREDSTVLKIAYPDFRAQVIEDQFEGDINKKDHGLQRSIIITLLQYLAQMSYKEMQTSNTNGLDNNTNYNQINLIVAIEEPELYLHPSRERYFSNLLLELSKERNERSMQVIYSTHSPYFVNLDRFNNIKLIRKETADMLQIPATNVYHYTIVNLLKDYAKIEGNGSDQYRP